MREFVELQPYGLVLSEANTRPMLLMKEKLGEQVLPVMVTVLEAQILSGGSDRMEGPHGAALGLLKKMKSSVIKAQFLEVRNFRQVLEIHFAKPDGTVDAIEALAESSMSFVLGAKAPIFATPEFVDQCRRAPLDLTQTATFSGDKLPNGLLQ